IGLGGSVIKDITFTDSLTGYIVTSSDSGKAYIFKTFNGGNNWNVNHIDSPFTFTRVIFLDENTGFACGTQILKTTNSGNNWSISPSPFQVFITDLAVWNGDTMWIAFDNGLTGGVFRTTNGGDNWTVQFSQGGQNPDKI